MSNNDMFVVKGEKSSGLGECDYSALGQNLSLSLEREEWPSKAFLLSTLRVECIMQLSWGIF